MVITYVCMYYRHLNSNLDLASAMLESFENNGSARETVTTTDDNGVVQFAPSTILQADGSKLSDVLEGRIDG